MYRWLSFVAMVFGSLIHATANSSAPERAQLTMRSTPSSAPWVATALKTEDLHRSLLRLRGGEKRKRAADASGKTAHEGKRASRELKIVPGDSVKDFENEREISGSRFAEVTAANKDLREAAKGKGPIEGENGESEDSVTSTDSEATPCPNCNKVHAKENRTKRSGLQESSPDSESEMIDVSALLRSHVLDRKSRVQLQRASEEKPVGTEEFDKLFQKCVDKDNLARALALYEDMRNRSLTPTFEALDAMLDLCDSHGRWDVGLAVMQDVKVSGITVDEKIYLKVMRVCAKLEEWDVVITLFDEMRLSGMEQDGESFSLALQAMNKVGEADRAVAELVRLKTLFEPSQDQYDNVISVLLDAGRHKEAQAMMKESNELNARLEAQQLAEWSTEESSGNMVSVKQACRDLGEEIESESAHSQDAGAEPEVVYPDSEGSGRSLGDDDEFSSEAETEESAPPDESADE